MINDTIRDVLFIINSAKSNIIYIKRAFALRLNLLNFESWLLRDKWLIVRDDTEEE